MDEKVILPSAVSALLASASCSIGLSPKSRELKTSKTASSVMVHRT